MQYMPSVTIFYAGLCGLILLVLSLNIFREYLRHAMNGNKGNEELWKRTERAQQSFVEFVPLCLILMFLIEIHGTPTPVLYILGTMLVVARILHAYGVGKGSTYNVVRIIGTQTTYLVLMICSLASIYYALLPVLFNNVR